MGLVVGVAGRIASGKTTLCSELAATLGCSMTSFSRFLRDEATKVGLEPTRPALQDLGARRAREGWEVFCRAVLASVGWERGQFLVLDGIRHAQVTVALREAIAPDRLVLVYVEEPSVSVWESRLIQKGIKSVEELERLERHPAEGDVTSLRDEADLVLRSTEGVGAQASEVVNFLNRGDGN